MDAKISLKEKFIDAPGKLELTHLHIRRGGNRLLDPCEDTYFTLKEKGDRIEVVLPYEGSLEDPKFNLQETLLTRIAISLLEAMEFLSRWWVRRSSKKQ